MPEFPEGLTYPEKMVLEAFHHYGGPFTVGLLSKFTGLNEETVGHVVENLEQQGHIKSQSVEYVRCEGDD